MRFRPTDDRLALRLNCPCLCVKTRWVSFVNRARLPNSTKYTTPSGFCQEDCRVRNFKVGITFTISKARPFLQICYSEFIFRCLNRQRHLSHDYASHILLIGDTVSPWKAAKLYRPVFDSNWHLAGLEKCMLSQLRPDYPP